MSVVSLGVLPGVRLQASKAPMAEVASVYLPAGAAAFITFGAIMAIMTALNGTMLVPSRLAMMFVKDRLAPNWVGVVNSRTATPIRGLTLTLVGCGVLLLSGQLSLALNIAVFALITLYFIHSVTFLLLPRLNPELYREISVGIPKWLLFASSALSAVAMGAMILVQVIQDVRTLRTQSLYDRVMQHSLTSLELAVVWSIFGAALYAFSRWMASRQRVSSDASL
jgi:amino acid transporter